MGIWDYMFDSEWRQRGDINEARAAIDHNARSSRRLSEDLRGLADEVGTLALFVRTIQRLLVEKGVVTREEFVAALRAIDAQDGKADGQYSGPMGAT